MDDDHYPITNRTMAVWQKAFHLDVENQALTTADIFPLLDKQWKRNWGGKGWQTWGDTESHDIGVSSDPESQVVDDIKFRVDLRKLDTEFIQKILDIAAEFKLKLKLIHVELLPPTMDNVIAALDKSDAKRFVQDPLKFIEGLGDKS